MSTEKSFLKHKNNFNRSLIIGLFLCFISISTYAAVVDNSTVTIINSSPQFSSSFPVSNVLDTADFTDYASSGQGTSTFIEFQLPVPMPMDRIVFTDRVTSAIAQGTCCSNANQDFVTGYSLTLSVDNNFTNGNGITDDIVVTVSGLVAPVGATSPVQFASIANLNGFVTEYIRWDVDSLNAGVNAGASNFVFVNSVPPQAIPSTNFYALLILIVGLIFLARFKLIDLPSNL